MRLNTINDAGIDTINVVGMQLKRRLERLGARQVEISRASATNPEATIVSDIGNHVILRSDLLIRVTAPDEFIVQIPTSIAKSIGVKESAVVHGLDEVNQILVRIMKA